MREEGGKEGGREGGREGRREGGREGGLSVSIWRILHANHSSTSKGLDNEVRLVCCMYKLHSLASYSFIDLWTCFLCFTMSVSVRRKSLSSCLCCHMWSCGYVVEGRGMVRCGGERDGTLWREEGWDIVGGRGRGNVHVYTESSMSLEV